MLADELESRKAAPGIAKTFPSHFHYRRSTTKIVLFPACISLLSLPTVGLDKLRCTGKAYLSSLSCGGCRNKILVLTKEEEESSIHAMRALPLHESTFVSMPSGRPAIIQGGQMPLGSRSTQHPWPYEAFWRGGRLTVWRFLSEKWKYCSKAVQKH